MPCSAPEGMRPSHPPVDLAPPLLRHSEPIFDRCTAWLWSWFAWLPGTERDSRTYLAQNDKVIAAFRKRLQQNMKRVRSLFGVTKQVTATSIAGTQCCRAVSHEGVPPI